MASEIEIDTVINTDRSQDGLKQLQKGLKELISLQGQISDKGSDQFKKLSKAINETEGKIGDLKDGFQTLRGSGIERVNSSLGLLREGFVNADPGKLGIAFKSLGTAMSAIPVFLLIEGFKILIDNFDKIVSLFSSSDNIIKQNKESLDNLTASIDANKVRTEALLITKENELKQLKRQSGSYDDIISKIKEIDKLKQSNFQGELDKTDQAIKNLQFESNVLKRSLSWDDFLPDFLGGDGTKKKIKEISNEIDKLTNKRGEITNQATVSEIATTDAISAERDKRIAKSKEEYDALKAQYALNAAEFNRLLALKQEYEELTNAARIADAQAASDKELEIIKKQIQDEKSFKSYIKQSKIDQDKEINAKIEADRRLDKENELAFDSAFQQKNLYQKIVALNQDRDTQLLNEQLTQQQRIAIIEKAENDITSLKIKRSSEYVSIAEQGIMGIQAISDIAFEINSKNLKKGSKEEDDAARKRFNINKGLQIANASIQGAQAVLAAFSSGAAIPVAGVVAGPAFAAVAGAVALANIAKISNTQYSSSLSSAPSSDSSSSIPSESIATPSSFSNFAPNNQSFNPSGQANAQTNSEFQEPMKVYVLESDIRNITNKVDVIESRATWP